jgi:peptidoglycan/xylan/chitin deacetylase (PgdA/CDA1 family)
MTFATIIIALAIFAVAWFLVPFAWRKAEERRLAKLCRAERAIVLTFDDGPGAGLTPRLLDMLERNQIPATFFMLGRNAAQNHALAGQVQAAGHEIGSHTFHHSNAWKTDPVTYSRDVEHGMTELRALGLSPHAFRPPYGKLTLASLIAARARDLPLGLWTIDSRDSWAPRPMDNVISDLEQQGGGVVLMHDLDSYAVHGAGHDHAGYVLELTERLISLGRKRGYTFKRYSEIASIAGAGG